MRLISPAFCLLAILFVAAYGQVRVAGPRPPAWWDRPIAGTLDGARQQHVEVLEHRLQAARAKYNAGVNLFEFVLAAELDLVEAQLETTQDTAKRIQFAEAGVAATENLMAIVRDQFDAGTADQEKMALARAGRLKAEIVLLQEKQRSKRSNRSGNDDGRATQED